MSIAFHVENKIAFITLNRPDKKNAMLLAMRDELAELCERVNDDTDVRVAILTGAGSDFCAGADVSEMGRAGISGSLLRARHMNKAISALGAVEKPLIGAVRGVALGMGLSMALACDYLIAGESLRMGCVQRKLGLCPDAGNVWFLNRLLGPARAKELVFSARMWKADESQAMGLVRKVVPDEKVLEEAIALAQTFSDAPSLALGAAKKMFAAAAAMTLQQFIDYEGGIVPLIAQSDDFREGTRSFLEKRSPAFTGN